MWTHDIYNTWRTHNGEKQKESTYLRIKKRRRTHRRSRGRCRLGNKTRFKSFWWQEPMFFVLQTKTFSFLHRNWFVRSCLSLRSPECSRHSPPAAFFTCERQIKPKPNYLDICVWKWLKNLSATSFGSRCAVSAFCVSLSCAAQPDCDWLPSCVPMHLSCCFHQRGNGLRLWVMSCSPFLHTLLSP